MFLRNDILVCKKDTIFFRINNNYKLVYIVECCSIESDDEFILYHIIGDDNEMHFFDETDINKYFIKLDNLRKNKLNKICTKNQI